MIYKKEICLELRKLRHRHTPALFLAVFALISAWMAWCFHDMDISRINDPAAMIYINMLLMNTILCPITAAVLASRMCDMEQIGDTYKWLCTMQKPEHIYRGKVLVGTVYMAVFSLMETVLFHFLTAPMATGVAKLWTWAARKNCSAAMTRAPAMPRIIQVTIWTEGSPISPTALPAATNRTANHICVSKVMRQT